MKTPHLYRTVVIVLTFLVSCTRGEETNTSNDCDQAVVIDNNLYMSVENNSPEINSYEIEGDCLKINISSSGCDGSTWIVKLIDSETIIETCPPQRNLKLSLLNNELCEAYITKEISFDISTLQVNGGIIWLNIVNTDIQIAYQY